MTSPLKPWEMDQGILRRAPPNLQSTSNLGPTSRAQPPLPPKPHTASPSGYMNSGMTNNYMPYTGSSLGYSSYGSMPYRSSLYSSFGGAYGQGYGGVGGYNTFGNYGYGMNSYPPYGTDDAERRFIQYAEESSRSTFANVENIVRAFSSIAMMLDNTFFAMTSSFRAVLSVAENMGRLRTMFGHIWYSVSIFRLLNWMYRKFMQLIGVNIPVSARQAAWSEATNAIGNAADPASGGSSWPTLAFFGVLLSAPYFISKILPKYEDKASPSTWKSPGIRAKVAFDFVASSPNEMSVHTNDELLLAPMHVQEEMKLLNSGWAFAVCNGKSGVVPLNYLVVMKKVNPNQSTNQTSYGLPKEIPRNNVKRVSFGENQIFESTDPPPHKPHSSSAMQESSDAEGRSQGNEVKAEEVPQTREEISQGKEEIPQEKEEIPQGREEISQGREEIPQAREEVSQAREVVSQAREVLEAREETQSNLESSYHSSSVDFSNSELENGQKNTT